MSQTLRAVCHPGMANQHQCMMMHQTGELLPWRLLGPQPQPVLLPPPPLLHHSRRRCCCSTAAVAAAAAAVCLLLVCLDHGCTAQATSAAGSNETDLLARGCPAGHGGGVTNVLVVTTTVGMLHWVHGHTTHLRGGERGGGGRDGTQTDVLGAGTKQGLSPTEGNPMSHATTNAKQKGGPLHAGQNATGRCNAPWASCCAWPWRRGRHGQP